MKKLLLTAAMAIMAAFSAHPFTVDGITYSTSDGVATITGASDKTITKLTIPATVTYRGTTYPVNNISWNAFSNCTSLRELVIEDSDTHISTNSYTDPTGLFHIGNPFANCPIEKIYVGRNLAQRYSNGNVAGGVTPINSTASNIDLTIAGKSTFILQGLGNDMSFNGKTNITSLTIGGNVENVYNKAFSGCTGLKKVTLLPGETDLNMAYENIFNNCPIDTVIIHRNISGWIFSADHCIKSLTLASDLKYFNCSLDFLSTKYNNVIIEDSDTPLELGGNAIFDYCDIDSVYFGRYLTPDLYNNNIKRNATIRNAEFGPMITEIEDYFVRDLSNLTSVKLSENVSTIKFAAFYQTGITEIDLPQSLTIIEGSAFGRTNLRKITLPEKIESIGDNAFYDTPIESISFPPSLKFLGGKAFSNCDKLKKVVIEDAETPLELDGNPIFFHCDIDSVYFGRYLTPDLYNQNIKQNATIRNAEFGPMITEIEDYFVRDLSNLTSVKLSENVSTIKFAAFYQTGITEIDLPQSLTIIEGSAFGRTNLRKITLPEKIESIGDNAFYDTPIESISFPPSLKFLGGKAFSNCDKLKKVVIEDAETPLELDGNPIFFHCDIDSVYFGRYLTPDLYNQNIKQNATIRNAEFGPMITEIEDYFVRDQSNLTSVKLSENVSTIKFAAFYQTGITEIDLPQSLTLLENSSLKNCPLTSIKCSSTNPSTCESDDVFSQTVYDSAVLTVPAGSKKAYRAAEVWKLFKNIQSEGGGFKVTVTCDSSLGEVALNGSNVAEITVDEDEPLTIAITPIEGYKVSKMTVNGTDITSSLVDNVIAYESIDSNMDIVVEFDIITFAVNLPAGLTGGRIVVNGQETAPATVDYGSRLELAAVADRGYELTALSVNETDVIESLDENGAYVIESVTADISVEAAFEPIVYTVTAVNLTDYGTLTLNGEAGDCKVAFGQPLVIGVMPRDEGCYLVALTVDGTDVTAGVTGGTYTVETVEADMTVEAVFGFYTYTVQLGYDPAMGTIIPDQPGGDSEVTVAHGTTLRLTIIPAEGYEIATVTLDGDDVTGRVDNSGVLTLENITAAHRVEATFDIKRVRLSVLGLQGGQLAMRYDYGTEVTLLVEPEDGWEFHSLTVGDTTVTELEPDGSYTTPALTDDTAVSVVFKLAGQSGADSPAEARMITVATRGTTVIVTGARDGEQVEVFDTAGVAVYRGAEHEIDLNRQGIHIVRVAGLTFKVMLR